MLLVPIYFFLYFYLDQIIPDTFGIAKSWNFCCKRKKHAQVNQSLIQNEEGNLDPEAELKLIRE